MLWSLKDLYARRAPEVGVFLPGMDIWPPLQGSGVEAHRGEWVLPTSPGGMPFLLRLRSGRSPFTPPVEAFCCAKKGRGAWHMLVLQ